ncbi:hypothetical protein [Edaphobacter dinghuensis]|uniref:Uncharacterized protein n=1 Tax=Edaphobacter dinghuensis TaxID=1560005 RepID=A0A917M9N9_9BACT|nr:hypothetical protein [Edaphobacter dinghuensis]GGG86558.1 hypothetical protein GCM10011585_33140 [Edaphobacter dinghuensis]
MSINAAANELTKEIQRLTKEAERLTKLRDSILSGSAPFDHRGVGAGRKKAGSRTAAHSQAPSKKSSVTKKRTISAAGRKRIAEAQKRRWAEKKKAESGK